MILVALVVCCVVLRITSRARHPVRCNWSSHPLASPYGGLRHCWHVPGTESPPESVGKKAGKKTPVVFLGQRLARTLLPGRAAAATVHRAAVPGPMRCEGRGSGAMIHACELKGYAWAWPTVRMSLMGFHGRGEGRCWEQLAGPVERWGRRDRWRGRRHGQPPPTPQQRLAWQAQ